MDSTAAVREVTLTPMRILTMSDTPRDPNSGAAGTEMRTIEALRVLRHHVDEVWSDQLGRRIQHGNLHYLVELPRTYRREMKRAMKQAAYDVIHVNQPHGWLAAKELRRSHSDAVFVHRSHGFERHADVVLAEWHRRLDPARPPLPRRAAQSLMRRLLDRHVTQIAKYADGHIISSTADFEFMTAMGIDPKRIAVIPLAAPDEFHAAPARPMTADRLRRVLYISQFAFFKAPMIVAQAIIGLARNRDLQFTWVCGRSHHDEVRALLGDVRDRVELLDWQPVQQLIDVYDAHGIFLFPSFYEGFGKVILEAMCRGLCTVATNIGGARDVIRSGENGVLVEPGDANGIVEAVETLLADPEKAVRMSALAASSCRTYTWMNVARESAAFYERLRSMRR